MYFNKTNTSVSCLKSYLRHILFSFLDLTPKFLSFG